MLHIFLIFFTFLYEDLSLFLQNYTINNDKNTNKKSYITSKLISLIIFSFIL